MKNIDIKIVGAVADESTLEEIENIAKVFAYEQRMKEQIFPIISAYRQKNSSITLEKKSENQNKTIPLLQQPRILVKGLS